MYFLALAADYDGTLAHQGAVDDRTRDALRQLKETGRRVILVTGRELADLQRVCPDLELFDRVVVENGALLYDPATQEEQTTASAPPAAFLERLRERGVEPLSSGRVIVSTWQPHERDALEVIRDMGLELQIIFNKGAVMILPSGVNKATGLSAVLRELGLSPHNVVGVGDAENDHAFMSVCGCAAAVANALPLVKEEADVVLEGDHGAGVIELVERIVEDDESLISPERHGIPIGVGRDGKEVLIVPNAGSVLIAGSSGIGKSTFATALMEQMAERGFEFCVFDPEGDYDELEPAIVVGDAATPPQQEEALELLEQLGTNVVVNTQSYNMEERPTFFGQLLPRLSTLRSRTGRPHWLLIDEAHHLMPVKRSQLATLLPGSLPAVILITVHPEAVSPDALRSVSTVLALGEQAPDVIAAFCAAAGLEAPGRVPQPNDEEVLVWEPRRGEAPRPVAPSKPRQSHKRHTRKYAEGDLGEKGSFYFRGPGNALNLRAQNLQIFIQIASGVDDATWEHHRRARDYSQWFRTVIKDADLAEEAAAIEEDAGLDPRQSRARITEAIERRYTLPATAAD